MFAYVQTQTTHTHVYIFTITKSVSARFAQRGFSSPSAVRRGVFYSFIFKSVNADASFRSFHSSFGFECHFFHPNENVCVRRLYICTHTHIHMHTYDMHTYILIFALALALAHTRTPTARHTYIESVCGWVGFGSIFANKCMYVCTYVHIFTYIYMYIKV